MTRSEQFRQQWTVELEKIEDGYADALEAGADPYKVAQMEGMIAAYQRIIASATR